MDGIDARALERRTMRKVMWRLLPLVALMFLCNSVDRVNVSFAALTMNKDLGLSTLGYAWGAGIFFFAYFAFEIPSNLIMEKVGARLWMTRIMLTWGMVSAATALVTGIKSFLLVRFLLGAAEAGLVPGIVLYISYWFPPLYRGRAVAFFVLAQPMSFVVAGLLSAPLLRMEGVAGLHGWQWMFLLEAVPSLLLSLVVFRFLTDRPRAAAWLTPEERRWLEARTEQPAAHANMLAELRLLLDRRIAFLATIYIGRTTAMYGISLFLPLIVQGMGVSNERNGLISAMPFFVATMGSLLIGWSSDRRGERHWHTIGNMGLAAVGMAAAAWLGVSAWSLVAISLAAIGLYAQPSTFWPLPGRMLAPSMAAAAIAAINAIGNLGGFFGPYIVGWTQQATGDYASGLYLLAGFALASGGLGIVLKRRKWEREEAVSQVPL